jgi:hypothetical protein
MILIAGGADIFKRGAKGITAAIAGIDRLILKDNERQAHCDAASFLSGYLLGLPCFCYQSDVSEALKLLRESSELLNVYKQKKINPNNFKLKSTGNFFSTFFSEIISGKSESSSSRNNEINSNDDEKNYMKEKNFAKGSDSFLMTLNQSNELKSRQEESLINLGRVLIWLMAPVVAESLRYGMIYYYQYTIGSTH